MIDLDKLIPLSLSDLILTLWRLRGHSVNVSTLARVWAKESS